MDKVLSTKPWQAADFNVPEGIHKPFGMIGPEERRCFYWLSKQWWQGTGFIVDAGSFLGASTFCFAAGVRDNPNKIFKPKAVIQTVDYLPVIHAYDYFRVVDDYVAEHISRDLRPVETGDSYLDLFMEQVAPCRELITPFSGDFLEHRWVGDPVEILFIDIAKTQDLNSHAVAQFMPCLIPERSVVIQQDYFHCWHPYIHISMEYLCNEFKLMDELIDYQSRLWQIAEPIPPEKIKRLKDYAFDRNERLQLLSRLIEKSTLPSRPMIEVVRIWQHCLDKEWTAARQALTDCERTYRIDEHEELWARQARELRTLLAS